MVAGDVAELVAEPCPDVLDALVPGWQDAAVDEGLADLAAGLAARVGIDELMGQRAVVAGQVGEQSGAAAAR